MRVILKPGGLFCILGAFGVLTTAALWKYNHASGQGSSDPTALAASSSPTPQTASLPKGVLLMPDIASEKWQVLVAKGKMSSTIVGATVPGHPQARRIEATEIGPNPWDLQVAHPLDTPFIKGSHLRLTYWARSKDSCHMTVSVEKSAEPYDKIVYKEESLTPTWKSYSEQWEPQADTPSGWAKVDFQVGHKVGEIEITGVTIRQAE